MSDNINPDHYKRLPAEAIEIIESAIDKAPSNQDAYLHGQVLKYVLRCWNKSGIEDLRKAKWYLDRLVNSLNESEQQKAADLQSLKDHPFGKLKQSVVKESLTAKPDPGEGYRLLSKDPPEKLLDTDEGLFACGCNSKQWLSVNYSEGEQLPSVYYRRKIEPAKAHLNSDTIPEGYRKLGDSSIEPRQVGDLYWSVSKKRYVAIVLDHLPYANRDNWAACRKVDPVIKQSLNTEPPDGWRWLRMGEPIRKGDKPKNGDAVPSFWIGTPCCNNQFILRRNKFEVGEKVVHGDCKSLSISVVENILDDGWVDLVRDGVSTAYHVKDLAPYIEVTREVTGEVTGEVKPPDGWRFLEVGEVIRKEDQGFENGLLYAIEPMKIGMTLQSHWMPTIRRNKFEVGEKVIDCRAGVVFTVQHFDKEHQIVFVDGVSDGIESKHFAPYIEDAK